MNELQVAAGSTIGRAHRTAGRNNQDAWSITQSEGSLVAVVADGCSGGVYSEVGAHIGVSLLATVLSDMLVADQAIDWPHVEQVVLERMAALVRDMGPSPAQTVERFFLFTLVGVVMNPTTTTFFACGDGLVVAGDDVVHLGPFAGNQPPYLAYRLLGDRVDIDMNAVRLAPVWHGATSSIDHFLIGTDGVDDMIAHETAQRPGLDVPVGPLSQFWHNDRYFRGNPELVNRELKLMGRDWPPTHPQAGLLSDDTTLIVGRRSPEN